MIPNRHGGHTEVGPLQRLLLKHPKDGFVSQEQIDRQWESLRYTAPPVLNEARSEYEQFVALLARHVPEIAFLPPGEGVGLDSIYARDASVVTDAGVILCNMGKGARANEPQATAEFLESAGIPILGRIGGRGTLEGGDLVWLGQATLAVGRGYRTNDEGIAQLWDLVSDFVEELIVVPLPHWQGPGDVFHLMSMLSPVDQNLLAVYSALLPIPFREQLLERGFGLIEIPDREFDNMACNILAVAPGKCITLEGNPRTKRLLEKAGVEVITFKGDEISRKGSGGPTCLTRPLWRSFDAD